MTIVILQYPLLIICYIVSLAMVMLTGMLQSYSFMTALVAGLTTVIWITGALLCRIPLDGILVLLLTELLICCLFGRKGESL